MRQFEKPMYPIHKALCYRPLLFLSPMPQNSQTPPVFSKCHVAAWRPIKASAREKPWEPPTGSFVEVSQFASQMSCQSFRQRPAGGSICVLVLIKPKQVVVCEASARLRPSLWVQGSSAINYMAPRFWHTHTLCRLSHRATAVMSLFLSRNWWQSHPKAGRQDCQVEVLQLASTGGSQNAGKTDKSGIDKRIRPIQFSTETSTRVSTFCVYFTDVKLVAHSFQFSEYFYTFWKFARIVNCCTKHLAKQVRTPLMRWIYDPLDMTDMWVTWPVRFQHIMFAHIFKCVCTPCVCNLFLQKRWVVGHCISELDRRTNQKHPDWNRKRWCTCQASAWKKSYEAT